jgi:hypothetical protein
MPRRNARFRRLLDRRRYRRLFVLATEGTRTEPEYFRLFSGLADTHIQFVPHGQASSPDHLLRAMRRYHKSAPLKARDQAWIVVDTDAWTEEQLRDVHAWSLESERHGLAVSNPMFEYWLLLHFEDGDQVTGARECRDRLARHLPQGAKCGLPIESLRGRVDGAVERAVRRDCPPCPDWPRRAGTTVYRLVQALRGG